MKAVSTIFEMNKFKIGSDNCDSAQTDAGLMAGICEAHFRSVPNKPLNEVMEPQPEWKTKGYVEDIRNLWNPNVDYFLRALRNPHVLIKSKPLLSIAGGDNTDFAAWTDSTGCLGSNYTLADNIRCIAEAEGHKVHDIRIASAYTYKDCFTWLKGLVAQAGGEKKLNMTILIIGMANDVHGFTKDELTANQVQFYTAFAALISACENCCITFLGPTQLSHWGDGEKYSPKQSKCLSQSYLIMAQSSALFINPQTFFSQLTCKTKKGKKDEHFTACWENKDFFFPIDPLDA